MATSIFGGIECIIMMQMLMARKKQVMLVSRPLVCNGLPKCCARSDRYARVCICFCCFSVPSIRVMVQAPVVVESEKSEGDEEERERERERNVNVNEGKEILNRR